MKIKNFLTRICGICQIILNKENTGELQYLQPNCNKCTKNAYTISNGIDIKNYKVKLTTTLELLKSKDACSDGLETLIKYLGEDYPQDKEINLLTILKSNGVRHCFWAFRATKEDNKIALRLICADIAESVLHIFEEKYFPKNIICHIKIRMCWWRLEAAMSEAA